jgi:hypothetical protein
MTSPYANHPPKHGEYRNAFTPPDIRDYVNAVHPVCTGDTFTIAGVYRKNRRFWWQFWKPRYIPTPENLKVFRVVDEVSSIPIKVHADD